MSLPRTVAPIFKPYFELSRKEKDMLWHGLPCQKHLPLNERVCIDSFFQMVKDRSEEHTSELQSHYSTSYAVF